MIDMFRAPEDPVYERAVCIIFCILYFYSEYDTTHDMTNSNFISTT